MFLFFYCRTLWTTPYVSALFSETILKNLIWCGRFLFYSCVTLDLLSILEGHPNTHHYSGSLCYWSLSPSFCYILFCGSLYTFGGIAAFFFLCLTRTSDSRWLSFGRQSSPHRDVWSNNWEGRCLIPLLHCFPFVLFCLCFCFVFPLSMYLYWYWFWRYMLIINTW